MSKLDKLKEIIRELIKNELEEASTSANVPGYQTPYAFRGKRKKDKDKEKKIATNSTGYDRVNEGSYEEKQIMNQLKGEDLTLQIKSSKGKTNFLKLTPEAAKKIAKIMKTMIPESINEGRYHDYRNDKTMTPKQKIGRSMREIRDSLNELNRLVKMNVRLKNELNVDSKSYWKNTHKALNKISERLVKLANKVGQLQ
tara:strand:+ start:174 stop:767 length:594 start_codon:yes stop_codon:yes gene_type:complete